MTTTKLLGMCMMILLVLPLVSAVDVAYESASVSRMVGDSPEDVLNQLDTAELNINHASYYGDNSIWGQTGLGIISDSFDDKAGIIGQIASDNHIKSSWDYDDVLPSFFQSNELFVVEAEGNVEHNVLISEKGSTAITPSDALEWKQEFADHSPITIFDSHYAGLAIPGESSFINGLTRYSEMIAPSFTPSREFVKKLLCNLGNGKQLGESFRTARNEYYQTTDPSSDEPVGVTLQSYHLYGNPFTKVEAYVNNAFIDSFCDGEDTEYSSAGYSTQGIAESIQDTITLSYSTISDQGYDYIALSEGELSFTDYETITPIIRRQHKLPTDAIITSITYAFSDPVDITANIPESQNGKIVDRSCFEEEQQESLKVTQSLASETQLINIYIKPLETVSCSQGSFRLYTSINYEIMYESPSPLMFENLNYPDKIAPDTPFQLDVDFKYVNTDPIVGDIELYLDEELIFQQEISSNILGMTIPLTSENQEGIFRYKLKYVSNGEVMAQSLFDIETRLIDIALSVPSVIETQSIITLDVMNYGSTPVELEIHDNLLLAGQKLQGDANIYTAQPGLNQFTFAYDNLLKQDQRYKLQFDIGYNNQKSTIIDELITNHAPLLAPLDEFDFRAGDLVDLGITAMDVDSDPISYTFSNPLGSDGTWQTSESDAGEYEITVTASDGLASVSKTFTLSLPINNPPVVETLPDITVEEGDLVELFIYAYDDDSDPLVYSIDNAEFVQDGSVFTWQTAQGDLGEYTIQYSVSDGRDTVSASFLLVIEEKTPSTSESTSWYDGSWQFRKGIILPDDLMIENFHIPITVDTASLIDEGKLQQDASDLRFTDDQGNELSYWIDGISYSTQASIWVNVEQYTSMLFMYYGNPDAQAGSDFDQTFSKDITDSSLLGLWNMDEGFGSVSADTSVYSNDGLIHGASWDYQDGGHWGDRTDQKYSEGSSLEFDGTDDYIEIQDKPELRPQEYTIEAWINAENNKDFNWIVSKDSEAWSSPYYSYTMYGNSAGTLFLMGNDGSDYTICTVPNAIVPGTWQHIAGSYDGNALKIYLDGKLRNSCTIGSVDIAYFDTPLLIGKHRNYQGDSHFAGKLDAVALYGKALDIVTINSHYHRSQHIVENQNIIFTTEETAPVPFSDWNYKLRISIDNYDESLKDYQMQFVIDKTTLIGEDEINEDLSDIRFADDSGNPYSYWIDPDKSSSASFVVWVIIPQFPADGILNMYYGNPTAQSMSDFDGTFTKEAILDGLVGSWHMDEGSGITLGDSSSNQLDGTLNGGDWAAEDGGHWGSRTDVKFGEGSSVIFDGTDDYVSIANDPILELQEYTIEAWINVEQNKDFNWIVSKDSEAWSSPYYSYTMYGNSAGTLFLMGNDGSDYTICTVPDAIVPGTWQHIAGSYDGNALKIYLDGKLRNSCTIGSVDIAYFDTPLLIGKHRNYQGDSYFAGQIDELKLFSRALSKEEISADHSRRVYAQTQPSYLFLPQTSDIPDMSAWQSEQVIAISPGDNDLYDYQVVLEFSTASWVDFGTIQPEGQDFRFITDEGISVPYWIEGGLNTRNTRIWLKVPYIDSSEPETYLTMYYNNPTATSISNFDSVFTKEYDTEGLVGSWHMDEGSGITLGDSSSNQLDGTLNGAGWAAEDGGHWGSRTDVKFGEGSSVIFDGTDDYVSIANDPILELQEYTIEAWINVEQNKDFNWIVSKDSEAWSSPYYSYTMYSNSAGTLFLMGNDGSDYTICTVPNAIVPGTWQHIAGSYDGNALNIYLDGTLRNSCTIGSVDIAYFDTPLLIGKHRNYQGDSHFAGQIDEVRLYNRALANGEIAAHYYRKQYSSSELNAYLKFFLVLL